MIEADRLAIGFPGTVLRTATFRIGPGLALVRGGDGRGKTTLLRTLAGVHPAQGGTLRRDARTLWWADPVDPADDELTGRERLARWRAAYPDWDAADEAALVEGFALGEHLGKELFRLSAGTRRKLALAAAFASRADLVLLDLPFAALDARSRALLGERLARAAAARDRTVVVAEHEVPEALAGLPLAATIDLGD